MTMINHRPLDQMVGEMTPEERDEAMGRVRKAHSEYRAELVYEFGLLLDFPTDDNQQALQGMLTRYRHLWMRAHDRPDEVKEDEDE